MKKYLCSLINNDGCNFDNATFTNKKEAKKWATGRGTNPRYSAVLENRETGEEVEAWTPRG